MFHVWGLGAGFYKGDGYTSTTRARDHLSVVMVADAEQ